MKYVGYMNPYCSTPAGIRRIKAIARDGNMLWPRLTKGQKTSATRTTWAIEEVSRWADQFVPNRGPFVKFPLP